VTAYYNENDPFNVEWLKHLMAAKVIAPGEIDGRDIQQVRAEDLKGFTQCHFFAGIGVWSYALRCAGWEDSQRVWTGSCPCQPFSVSGKRAGASDERHLWPEFFRLISIENPLTVFGEQVASDDGLAWLDLVSSDLEGQGYTVGAVDTPACGFGAPHRRQRLYWVAQSDGDGRGKRSASNSGRQSRAALVDNRSVRSMADSKRNGRRTDFTRRQTQGRETDGRHCEAGDVGHTPSDGRPEYVWLSRAGSESGIASSSILNGFWSSAEWLYCRDEKYRPVEPGTFPLAHGIANRVGKLRGYGNALVAPQAEGFIRAYMELDK